MEDRPPLTRLTHTLPFDKLGPADFERLCLWLVQREGYEHAQHLGAAGKDGGWDFSAMTDEGKIAFQCKRERRFGPTKARRAVSKILDQSLDKRVGEALDKTDHQALPIRIILLVACDVTVDTRRAAAAAAGEIPCEIWVASELDEKVKRHRDILEHFFDLAGTEPSPKPQQSEGKRHYLKRLRHNCLRLHLAALGDYDTTGSEKTLDQIYIDLDTTTPAPLSNSELKVTEGWEDVTKQDVQGRLLTAMEAATTAHRLVLLGEPGAGKSTFVKALLAEIAKKQMGEINALANSFSNLLPIMVNARELASCLREHMSKSGSSLCDVEYLTAQSRKQLAEIFRTLVLNSVAGWQAESFREELAKTLEIGHCIVVFDGLDEVPEHLRAATRQVVVASIEEYGLQRVIVTCRQRSYYGDLRLKTFTSHALAPFSQQKIIAFANAWYSAAYASAENHKEYPASDFVQATLSPSVIDMASNPMLLTVIAIIHEGGIGLPRERVRLYHQAVEVLSVRWQKHKPGSPLPSEELSNILRDDLRVRAIIECLAYKAHCAEESRARREEPSPGLDRGALLVMLEAPEFLGSTTLADEFLDYVDQRAGLLVGRGGQPGKPSVYSFPHRTFQEYLAGCYMIGCRYPGRVLTEHAARGEFWNLAAQLGAEDLLYNKRRPYELLDLSYYLYPDGRQVRRLSAYRAALWSGTISALLGVKAIEQDTSAPGGGTAYLKRIRRRLVKLLDCNLSAPERADAGRALANLCDSRMHVLDLDQMQFCSIPRGKFLYLCEDRNLVRKKAGYWIRNVGYDFWLSLYPVTNAQFDFFVKDGGYTRETYWPEAKLAGIWKDGRIIDTPRGTRVEPVKYGSPFDLPNYPTAGVTWYEAIAFARWVTERWREMKGMPETWFVVLPSELEWEKAARGGVDAPRQKMLAQIEQVVEGCAPGAKILIEKSDIPARRYPWGNGYSNVPANCKDAGVGATSAVGCFYDGRSPYGCQEMIGNINEWTRSAWRSSGECQTIEDAHSGKEYLHELDIPRVLRGGDYTYEVADLSCSARFGYFPMFRGKTAGFRLALVVN